MQRHPGVLLGETGQRKIQPVRCRLGNLPGHKADGSLRSRRSLMLTRRELRGAKFADRSALRGCFCEKGFAALKTRTHFCGRA